MIHDEVIKTDGLPLLLRPLNLKRPNVLLEFEVPFLLEGFAGDEAFPEDSNIDFKHVRVSSFLKVFLNFSHFPPERILLEVGNVAWNDFPEESADLREFGLEFLEVKLEGAEGDAAIVKGGDREVSLASHGGFAHTLECITH
jgi:hypothetical protein